MRKEATLTHFEKTLNFIKLNIHHIAAIILITLWCLPYLTSGQRISWGDFSFFAQGYEAMRISIMDFGQFPWWNPWVSGGIPLYANPQFGLFSIQAILVFIFGSVVGLKLAIFLYTLAGYFSMHLLLRKYFKIDSYISVALSLAWVFGTFFVNHLPSHFTFVWYMLVPLYVYLSLTARTMKDWSLLGLAFAVMALSQTHNPFVHISVICAAIIGVRFLLDKHKRDFATQVALAGLVFLVIAGHRVFYTLQNISQFPREGLTDLAPNFASAVESPFLPFSKANPIGVINYPGHPLIPHGFHEASAYISMGVYIAALIGCILIFSSFVRSRDNIKKTAKKLLTPIVILILGGVFFLTALGDFGMLSPYNIIKHLPILSSMRVSTRWFLFFNMAVILFVGLAYMQSKRNMHLSVIFKVLIFLGTAELFLLNAGYQNSVFSKTPVTSTQSIRENIYAQTAYFGEKRTLPDGDVIPNDGSMPDEYREYEATTFNLGVLYANDSFVQLQYEKRYRPGHPTCPFEEGCSFVKSGNAKVVEWSPQKIVLERTDTRPIYLNMNNSSYFLINGKRNVMLRASEPLEDFVITDQSKTITIQAKPSILESAVNAIKN